MSRTPLGERNYDGSSHFRHIFPALIPFRLGFVKLVERIRSSSRGFLRLGVALGRLMVAFSFAFFIHT